MRRKLLPGAFSGALNLTEKTGSVFEDEGLVDHISTTPSACVANNNGVDGCVAIAHTAALEEPVIR